MDRGEKAPAPPKTGVVLKGLKSSFSVENLQSILSKMKLQYNFIYLPWDSKRSCNSGLGFINFLDAQSAERCIRELSLVNSQGTPRLFRTIRESSAHGIAQNLAFFMISAGMKPIDHDHAPLVFDDTGQPVDLRYATSKFVTMGILLETKELWDKSRQGKIASRNSQEPAEPLGSPTGRTRLQTGTASDMTVNQHLGPEAGRPVRSHRFVDVQGDQAVSQRPDIGFQQRIQDMERWHRTWQEMQDPRQNLMPSACLEELHASATRGFHPPAHLGTRSYVENGRMAAIPGSHSVRCGPPVRLGGHSHVENGHVAATPCSHCGHSEEHWHRTVQAMQESRQKPPGMSSQCMGEFHAGATPSFPSAHLGGHSHVENERMAAIPGLHSVPAAREHRHGMRVSQGPMDSRFPYAETSRAHCNPSLFRRPMDASYHSDFQHLAAPTADSAVAAAADSDSVGQQQANGSSSMPAISVLRIGDREFTVYGF